MKKKLIVSCRVRPYINGVVIDHQDFGSVMLGLKVATAIGSLTATTLKLALTESDTSSDTSAVISNKRALVGSLLDTSGVVTMDIPVTGNEAQIDIDPADRKCFVEIMSIVSLTGGTIPAATATHTLILGDLTQEPVE